MLLTKLPTCFVKTRAHITVSEKGVNGEAAREIDRMDANSISARLRSPIAAALPRDVLTKSS